MQKNKKKKAVSGVMSTEVVKRELYQKIQGSLREILTKPILMHNPVSSLATWCSTLVEN